jgi:hypothetical protein
MARRTAALAKAEKALQGARRRAANLRKKTEVNQPIVVASTIAGGAIDGAILSQTPQFLLDLDLDPGLAIGAVAVGYGLLSDKDGQLERFATAAGSGMLAAATSRFVQEM